jgi:hypothetical protein
MNPYSHEVYRAEVTDPNEVAAIALDGARRRGFEPVGEPTVVVSIVRYIVTWPDRVEHSSTVPPVP